jgi:hypothetical protein
MRKTGNRLRKMDEQPLFSGTIKGRYRGFIWRPARPRSWKSYCLVLRQKSVDFPHILQANPSKHVFYCCQLAWTVFYSKEWCCWETLCLSQEAVDGGAVAAQAAHNCCRRHSFLLLGHEPHFLRHGNFFKTSSSIFTKHLVKNFSKKKKGGRHGRLGRPTWTIWLKKT